jgi:predicted alpha/beta-hydrolase family hydrolase
MQTLILPGFSDKNREWASAVQSSFGIKQSAFISWQHWATGKASPDWAQQETSAIISKMAGQSYAIVAKSIGTYVAMLVLAAKLEKISHLILCGIPVNDFLPGNASAYRILQQFSATKCLVIQNEHDPHGSTTQVKDLLTPINPLIQVISMPRSDHEYPYFQQFKSFLI